RSAANHHAPGTGADVSIRLKTTTKMTLMPNTGVATETSPRLSVRNVNTCPTKKQIPATIACQRCNHSNGGPPRSHHSENPSAETQFVTNVALHGPAPPSVARFRNNADTT